MRYTVTIVITDRLERLRNDCNCWHNWIGQKHTCNKAAEKLGCPFVELDALFWKPNWVQEEKKIFRQKVSDGFSGSTLDSRRELFDCA